MNGDLPADPEFLPISSNEALNSEPPIVIDTVTGEVASAEPMPDARSYLEQLYQKHTQQLGRLAFFHTSSVADSEDVVAEVFTTIAERYDMREINDPLAFLTKAVSNRSKSIHRNRATHHRILPRLVPGDLGDSTSETVLKSADDHVVVQALRQLPERQRLSIVLRYYNGLSTNEIAERMGCKTGTVKSHTSRAMDSLRILLEPYFK